MRLPLRPFLLGGGAAALTTVLIVGAVAIFSSGPEEAAAVGEAVEQIVVPHFIGRATFILQDTALGGLGMGAFVLAIVILGTNRPPTGRTDTSEH